jgi:FkbM family methyltransferase
MKTINDFSCSKPNLDFLLSKRRQKKLLAITKKALPLFLRGNDIISTNPLVSGYHEDHIEKLIVYAAQSGADSFLLDIGANIGLTSCLTGKYFKQIFCFEPNPLVYRILLTNLEMSLVNSMVKTYPYGLGLQTKQTEITIPRHNYGGAFIQEGNSYSNQTLAKKDGFDTFNCDNYLTKTVDIKNAEITLKELFTIHKLDTQSGVIKIDVEGFETIILSALAKVLNPKTHYAIIFENHDDQASTEQILKQFDNPISLHLIKCKKPSGSRIIRWGLSLFGAKRTYYLEKITTDTLPKGDILMTT